LFYLQMRCDCGNAIWYKQRKHAGSWKFTHSEPTDYLQNPLLEEENI